MGGFHQLPCLQKVMYKIRLDWKQGWVGIGNKITTTGTTKYASAAEKAVHGLHYNTATRVYKEIFDTIVQMRTENIKNNYDSIDEVLKQNLIILRKGKTLIYQTLRTFFI